MSATPPAGIRLRGGAPIPPAPSLGRHRNVAANGIWLGATVEIEPRRYVPICAHPDCMTSLDSRDTHKLAAGALYGHWNDMHEEAAA